MNLSEILVYAVSAISIIIVFIIYFVRYHYAYWERRNIRHDKPHIPFGNLKGVRNTKNFHQIIREYYDKYKGTGPFVGFFAFSKPAALVLDLDLVKNILIKDFNNFDDRGMFYNERDDPLTAHLFALDGDKWRKLRNKLTPTFTSGRMKAMFPIVLNVGKELVSVVEEALKTSSDVEVKEYAARFTTDVIGNCAFGLECNSLRDPNAEFRVWGRKTFELKRKRWVFFFSELFPKLARLLRVKRVHDDITSFYKRIVRETIEYRESNNIQRNDFMNLLMELKNRKDEAGLTMNEITAQAFLFFLAGFDTSSTTMGFTLYELALNENIQDILRKEITDVTSKYNNEVTYEGLQEMKYMEMVLFETLRKYSIVSHLNRRAKSDYNTSDKKYYIEKNTIILIPVHAFHYDPDIYPDPEVFDPERFSPNEIQKRHSIAWLPFGDGPRNCIGLRFGKMQAYIGLTLLLKNFKISLSTETPIPLTYDKKNLLLSSDKGIVLKFERLSKTYEVNIFNYYYYSSYKQFKIMTDDITIDFNLSFNMSMLYLYFID